MLKPTFAYMKEFAITVKIYKRLLKKYNLQYHLYNQFNLELLVMAYLNDNVITYPDCFGHRNIISFIHRRKAISWLIRLGYIEIVKRNQFKITNDAVMICKDFFQDFSTIMQKHTIQLQFQ